MHIVRRSFPAVVFLILLVIPGPVLAGHYLPLKGFAPEMAHAGNVDLRLGASYTQADYLLFSDEDRQRQLVRVPEMSLAIGMSDNSELIISYEFLLLGQNDEPLESGSGDATITTILALLGETETIPGCALVISTKLPNANDNGGFGTDQTDFYVALAAAKGFGDFTFLANIGMGILSRPSHETTEQDDVLTYSLGAHYYLYDYVALGCEVSGMANSRFGNERGNVDFGVAFMTEAAVLDISAGLGLNEKSGEWRAGFGMSFPLLDFDPVKRSAK